MGTESRRLGADRAYLWTGSAGSVASLHPGGDYLESRAYATNGPVQAGWARQGAGGGGQPHACTWAGTASTFNDLNPLGYYGSTAYAIDGDKQVGYGGSLIYLNDHAMLWHGHHDHFDDLHPIDKPSWTASQAYDGAGGIQAGYVTGPSTHAAMWAGSYTSFIDLNPTGAAYSVAEATDGLMEGGYAYVGAYHGRVARFSLFIIPILPPDGCHTKGSVSVCSTQHRAGSCLPPL